MKRAAKHDRFAARVAKLVNASSLELESLEDLRVQLPPRVLAVNIATLRPYHDQTCILAVGEHGFVMHPSYICYDGARLYDEEFLTKWGKPDAPVSPTVLARILAGADQSDRIELGYQEMLRDQGLI